MKLIYLYLKSTFFNFHPFNQQFLVSSAIDFIYGEIWIRWGDIDASIPERVLSGSVQKDSGRGRVGQQLLQIRQWKAATIHIVSVPCGFNSHILRVTYNSEAGKKSHHVDIRLHFHRWSCLQCCCSEPCHAHLW